MVRGTEQMNVITVDSSQTVLRSARFTASNISIHIKACGLLGSQPLSGEN
jgi:hypothetical protein